MFLSQRRMLSFCLSIVCTCTYIVVFGIVNLNDYNQVVFMENRVTLASSLDM